MFIENKGAGGGGGSPRRRGEEGGALEAVGCLRERAGGGMFFRAEVPTKYYFYGICRRWQRPQPLCDVRSQYKSIGSADYQHLMHVAVEVLLCSPALPLTVPLLVAQGLAMSLLLPWTKLDDSVRGTGHSAEPIQKG